MDIHEIRSMLRFKSIYEIPMRVTYYARVSSESDEQLNSLGNQISYYEDLIRKNMPWTFIPGYIDEGLSGISTRKRENFNRMIEDAEKGSFDLVITKEISRFARNTLDSISFTRQLLSYGVGVFFQNDNINTLEEDSELRLSIMSSIAQEELRKLSSRVKFGHQQAIKSKVVLGNGRFETAETAAGSHSAEDNVRGKSGIGYLGEKFRKGGNPHEAVGGIDIPDAFPVEGADAEPGNRTDHLAGKGLDAAIAAAEQKVEVVAGVPEGGEAFGPHFVVGVDLENPVEAVAGGIAVCREDGMAVSAIGFVPHLDAGTQPAGGRTHDGQ